MIICPNCKQEIDDDSHYCDQCGQVLLFCENCGRVGLGIRCTSCGGMMVSPEQRDRMLQERNSSTTTRASIFNTFRTMPTKTVTGGADMRTVQPQRMMGIPQLTLYNPSLNIRLVGQNGAIIGRRQGIYQEFFANNKYISGVHAQLLYNVNTGWSIVDKHSSNGTRLNQHALSPDVPMSLKNGDILTIANVNFQVGIM